LSGKKQHENLLRPLPILVLTIQKRAMEKLYTALLGILSLFFPLLIRLKFNAEYNIQW